MVRCLLAVTMLAACAASPSMDAQPGGGGKADGAEPTLQFNGDFTTELHGALLAGYFRGASVDIGNEYLLASIAVVVIGGTSVAGGKANIPGLWGAALFLVVLQIMLNSYHISAGVRLVITGLVIIGVIVAAGGPKAAR